MTTETERRVFIDSFSTEIRSKLLDYQAKIIRPKGRTLYDFEREERKFATFLLTPEQRDLIFSIKSRETEIAYLPKSLFFFGSLRHDTHQDQVKILDILKEDLFKAGIRGVDVIFPSASDCMEIYEAELNSNHPINIFGKRSGYPLTRTSTELDPDSTVVIGLDDLETLNIREELSLDKSGSIDHLFGFSDLRNRGIHVDIIPKANNVYSGLYVMPIIIPA